MANIQTAPKVRKQIVYSKPRKILVEKYLSPKGEKLMRLATTKKEKDEIWNKYGKNRYRNNPESKPIKIIVHKINPVQI